MTEYAVTATNGMDKTILAVVTELVGVCMKPVMD